MEFLYFSLQKYEENLKRQNKQTTKLNLKQNGQ